MYNLLMKSSWYYNEWEDNQGRLYDVSFLAGRVFEYTAEAIKQRFTTNGSPDFDVLTKLPCLFTYEGSEVIGSIGRISEVRSDYGGKYQIIYTLPNIYPGIPINDETVLEALAIGAGERHRTHWAVKDVDLFEVTTRLLHREGNGPVVLPGEEMNRVWGRDRTGKKLAFLSHRAAYRGQVAQVREYLEKHGLRCFVAHEDVNPSTIWQNEILNALNTMDVFIGFVTSDFHGGGWPDQEVGYAYQRGVPRVFAKLEGADPLGMVAREQALATSWESAGQEIIAHLKQAAILGRSIARIGPTPARPPLV
ncbi:MAG: toll/interleukin-1 receptor domain-containing protein [Chloroflexi bacterium]|nr:toll/interleukin-1 receptor domain-containing protein [Chloroflexota bacterium]